MRSAVWSGFIGAALAVGAVAATPLAGCSTETKFTEVSPNTGTYGGGEEIELKGNAFPRSGVVVRFGTREATGVVVESDHVIKVMSPAGDKGTSADVTITFDDGRAFKKEKAFTYVDSAQNTGIRDKFFDKESAAQGGKKQESK